MMFRNNSLGKLSMLFGALSIVAGLGGGLGFAFAIPAIILGILAIVRKGQITGLGIAGLALSAVGIFYSIITMIRIAGA